jgi:hypothetical protein
MPSFVKESQGRDSERLGAPVGDTQMNGQKALAWKAGLLSSPNLRAPFGVKNAVNQRSDLDLLS